MSEATSAGQPKRHSDLRKIFLPREQIARSLAREFERNRRADSSSGASDQRNFAF